MLGCALGLVSLFGCATPATLDVGYHGSERGFTQALVAADAWNLACGRNLVNVHKGDGDIQLHEVLGTVSGQAAGETLSERPFLNMIGPKEAYEINVMQGSIATATFAHEFGHALGLGHADHGIMLSGGQLQQLDRNLLVAESRPPG